MNGQLPVTAQDFNLGRVTNPQQAEIFKYRLYDSILYPDTGLTQFSFFQQPVGQGVTSAVGAIAGSSKTFADTNMTLAGQLPSGMEFLIDSIEVSFDLGRNADEFLPFTFYQAEGVVTPMEEIGTVLNSGWLELNILQKNYVRDAPLLAFPPKTRIVADGASAATTVAATTFTSGLLRADGRPWYCEPRISIQPAVNFEVLIKFPTSISTTFVNRLRVALDGYVLRASQ